MSKITKKSVIKKLKVIPGVGVSIAGDLYNIGIYDVSDLKDEDPEDLYKKTCVFEDKSIDRCLLYVYRCAVYYASTNPCQREKDKLKWWNWKDQKVPQ